MMDGLKSMLGINALQCLEKVCDPPVLPILGADSESEVGEGTKFWGRVGGRRFVWFVCFALVVWFGLKTGFLLCPKGFLAGRR